MGCFGAGRTAGKDGSLLTAYDVIREGTTGTRLALSNCEDSVVIPNASVTPGKELAGYATQAERIGMWHSHPRCYGNAHGYECDASTEDAYYMG